MPSPEQGDTVGQWSIEKLGLLKKYLAAYVNILKGQSWCRGYEYIDAFAGTGKPKTRDEQQFVDGSPRIALSLRPAFTQYHFIEQSNWRLARLKKVQEEFPNHSISIYHGDCNTILREQILPQLSQASKKRAIGFIDPFGMQFELETMAHIAEVKTIEIFLNFPIKAINRGVLRKHPELVPNAAQERLNRFWGTNDWLLDFYEEDETLFGSVSVKRDLSGKELGAVFKKRLEQIFTHCTNPILITNSKNSPLYCLIFAGHNATGKKIAQDVFARHEMERQ